ncbi:hypothetical protein DXG01_014969 [Tephrocybe rancida]|nr:hypothetical protein DXG01_014969 [Tephrocybe rancida]
MPSSKRKLQSATLHDFFNTGGGSPVSFKGKRVATKRTPCVAPENVIVIDDSDSEPEVVQAIQSKKRHRRSCSSGEVEFVDKPGPNPAPATVTKCTSEKAQAAIPRGLKKQNSSALDQLLDTPVRENESSAPIFGTPFLLLPSQNSRSLEAGTPAETVPNLLPFGRPTLLLGNDHASGSSKQGASSSGAAISNTEDLSKTPDEPEQMMEFDFPADADDDWGMGDDETAFARAADEEEEDVEDISGISLLPEGDGVMQCPSCDMLLDGLSHLELAMHVNDCLDSVGGLEQKASALTKSNSSLETKPLQPLLSLIPPTIHGPVPSTSTDGRAKPSSSSGNAFSVLMSSHQENEAWKEATVAEKRDFRPNKSNGGRRKAPFYKVLQGMPIAVDAFRYGTIPGINAYFLTHAHSDHYTNLASNWKSGPIYCSEGTANLIIHMLSVDRKWVHPLPYDVPTEIPNTGGVRVTLIEANHCPGSCLFFYEGCQTINAGDSTFKSPFVGSTKIFRYLHCGDFRASPRHVLHPAVKGKRIDHVYLDTTYLDPKYTFPPQPLVISACAELARRLVAGEPLEHTSTAIDNWATSSNAGKQQKSEKMLVVVGTYSIGKERIVKAIAHALNSKVYCDVRKAAILRCQADAELDALLTSDPLEATVHLVPLGTITSDKLKVYVERFKGKFSKAAGFRPTGWTFTQPAGTNMLPTVSSIISRPHRGFNHTNLRPARNSTSTLQLFPVPYSEHSSFFELTCFAMSFDWGKMIATVNVGSESSRGKMAKWVARWEAERKKRGKDAIIPHRNIEYW